MSLLLRIASSKTRISRGRRGRRAEGGVWI